VENEFATSVSSSTVLFPRRTIKIKNANERTLVNKRSEIVDFECESTGGGIFS